MYRMIRFRCPQWRDFKTTLERVKIVQTTSVFFLLLSVLEIQGVSAFEKTLVALLPFKTTSFAVYILHPIFRSISLQLGQRGKL